MTAHLVSGRDFLFSLGDCFSSCGFSNSQLFCHIYATVNFAYRSAYLSLVACLFQPGYPKVNMVLSALACVSELNKLYDSTGKNNQFCAFVYVCVSVSLLWNWSICRVHCRFSNFSSRACRKEVACNKIVLCKRASRVCKTPPGT